MGAYGGSMGDPRLRRYVSRLQLSSIAARRPGSSEPSLASTAGAALWVDVSGFTSLTSSLAEKGPLGVEEVSQIMSAYFGRITDIASENGGDVIGYAGDGALILWDESGSGGLRTATALAVQAGAVMQREAGTFRSAPAVSLGLRVSVGSGAISIAEVGGVGGVWQFLVSGEAVDQAVRADRRSKVGDVLLSPEARRQIGEAAVGEEIESGEFRLASLSRPFVAPGPRRDLDAVEDAAVSDDALVPYVPRIALDRLAAEEESWLGEFRGVSVMFATLRGLVLEEPNALHVLHEVVSEIQHEVGRQEGRIYQFLTDDKGTTLIAAYGLPLSAHVDDAARCVRTALAIQALLPDGMRAGIGIAVGQAYCGVYGGRDRRQFAVVGPVMNRAARLAQQADGILCDESVVRALSNQPFLGFKPVAPLRLKGESEEVAVYKPARETAPAARARKVVGRKREREVLAGALGSLVEDRAGVVVVVEGEEGFGKSVLLDELLRRCGEADVTCLVGRTEEAESGTPYALWSPVVADLLEVEAQGRGRMRLQGATLERHLRERLPDDEGLRELLPLLGDVAPLDLPPTALTATMRGEVRAENTHRVLIALLQASARARPLAVLLEDAHLGDSASWDLLREVARRIPDILFVVGMRRVEDPPDGCAAVLEIAADRHLELGPLSRDEVAELLADRLALPEVPAAVVDLIYEKASGHPFFSEELGYALREHGVPGTAARMDEALTVASGEELEEALENWTLPTTVQGAITGRLDRLGADKLLTLRTASAIGLNFPLALLRDVYPAQSGRDDVDDHLAELAGMDLIHLEADGSEPLWGFKHAITRDVAYHAMPFGQRRELHRGIATWHEQRHGRGAPHLWALLGHHWQRAGASRRASRYLGDAGERALRQYANREAARLLSEALAEAEEAGLPEEQKAAWQLQLGQAYVNWSRYEDALPHLEGGISRHGHAAPRHPMAAVAHLVGQLFLQALHRLWPQRFVGRKAEDRDRILPLVPAYEGLVESHYLAGSTVPCLHAAVRSLNLAESAGPSVELARGYASFGAIMGFVPLHGVAESYTRRAVETAEAVEDPSGTAWVYLATGVYKAGKGEWDRAAGFLRDAARISEELGDRRRWEDSLQHLATVSYLTGDSERALEDSERLLASALGSGARAASASGVSEANVLRQLAALRVKAHCLLSTARFDEAWECVEAIRPLLRRPLSGHEKHAGLLLSAIEALLNVHQRKYEEASAAAESAIRQYLGAGVTSYDVLLEYGAAAEAVITLADRGEEHRRRWSGGSRQAIKGLSSHARVFPIGRPAAHLWRGVSLWQQGRERKALAAMRASVEASHGLGMPLVEGLSRLHLGARLEAGGDQQGRHLTAAASILEKIGARHYAERARAELEQR